MTPRVLYLMAHASAGGAERTTMLMVTSHDRSRYEPALLFFSDGPLVTEARSLGIEVHLLRSPLRLRHPLSLVRAVSDVRGVLRTGGFSLIHSCMAYAHLVGGQASLLSGIPSVLYQHGPLGAWMDGAASLLRCDRILTNSHHTAAEQRARAWRSRRIVVAPPAVNLQTPGGPEQSAMRAAVNDAHNIPSDADVIGMTARFDPWKGIDVALRAAAPLLRERPNLRFLLVGGRFSNFHPGHEEDLRALVAREGIANQVVFAGVQVDVLPYLTRMMMLVHASIQPEPFGLTIVEAMAAGVPVVAARAGGAAEIVEPGVNGLAHSPGDEVELRDAMRALLDDEALRTKLAAAGLDTVEARYRPAQMMRVIESTYDELLGTVHADPVPRAPALVRQR